MILGHLEEPRTYPYLSNNPIWRTAFEWLHNHHDSPPEDGEYVLSEHVIRAIVQTTSLKHRSECTFESHRDEIDIHFCFFGSECVDWAPVSALAEQTPYNPDTDSILYQNPSFLATTVKLTPRSFAIFFPGDGHMPSIQSLDKQIRKAVIKIKVRSLKENNLATL